MVCKHPFKEIEINNFGDVYTCCPAFINFHKIGNIMENGFEEIWNGESIVKLRERILHNDYSLCNLDICRQREEISSFNMTPVMHKFPSYVTLAYDRECNLQCITCRDNKYSNSKETIELYDKKMDTLLLPLLKDAEILALSGSGEAFFSSHSRALIKKLSSQNKRVLFNINTNGLLFNVQNCKQLGIYGRINEVFISLPSLNKKIYEEIMIGGNFNIALDNIKSAAFECNYKKTIKKVTLNSVISILNYKEIPSLIEFAKGLNIWLTISPFCYWGTKFGKDYEQVAVWEKGHKEFKKFKEVLQISDLSYKNLFMPPIFMNL